MLTFSSSCSLASNGDQLKHAAMKHGLSFAEALAVEAGTPSDAFAGFITLEVIDDDDSDDDGLRFDDK